MAESSSFDYTPCPLKFYDFKHLDHSKNCPTYEASLNKQIQLSELEALHADLSVLKEDVQNRIQLLNNEMTVLSDWQVKREYKRKHDNSDTTQSSGSGGRASKSHTHTLSSPHDGPSGPPPKRLRTEEHGTSSKRRSGGKKKIHTAPSDHQIQEDFAQPTKDTPVSKTTDKFWATVEPYCSDITEEDLKMLQDLGSSNDPSLFEIPPLGPHYSRQWGIQDIEDETMGAAYDLIKTEGDSTEEGTDGVQVRPLGPLTQKLMAAFLEDPAGSMISSAATKPSPSLPPISPTILETKLRDELVSLGLLDPANELSRDIANEDEDEILRELEKAQSELKKVIEYNRQQKQMLHSLARAEMRRQDIRRKLQDTDSELMEILRRFANYRQKKRREPISRKDREMAEKVLETRQRLVSQLLV